MLQHIIRLARQYLQGLASIIRHALHCRVYFGRHLKHLPAGALVFFPLQPGFLACGLAGIVAYKHESEQTEAVALDDFQQLVDMVCNAGFSHCQNQKLDLGQNYLGGAAAIDRLLQTCRSLINQSLFVQVFADTQMQQHIKRMRDQLEQQVVQELEDLTQQAGRLEQESVDLLDSHLEKLKDAAWCLRKEVLGNITKVARLMGELGGTTPVDPAKIAFYKRLNAVLNGIDRLEVRGRDSAGISLMFTLENSIYEVFRRQLDASDAIDEIQKRLEMPVLTNGGISIQPHPDESRTTIAIVYKVAAEIGSLGDNIIFLRWQIQNDPVLRLLMEVSWLFHSVSSHTRWASVGAITEANCHPVDNRSGESHARRKGIIHVSLNGDIDNYQELRQSYEQQADKIHPEITTDTKIIPLQIEHYLQMGHPVHEAFRRAVNDFEGSHAISMHTDLAPGKLFLAQRGSGQTIFVGLAADHYMPTSEVYGLVEETDRFIKLDGEKVVAGPQGDTQGQLFILDPASGNDIEGITAMYYDGSPVLLDENSILHTAITSRDIDRQDFPHYFLKEISEAPASVEKTIRNRWKIGGPDHRAAIALDEHSFPSSLATAFREGEIRQVYFVGQGTAGVAALACANILEYYLNDPLIAINALKASELSGFKLGDDQNAESMAHCLVVAISQSGTTTDTNRTVDMVKERGAHTLAIVNRRDSDLTFKVDGVIYTSSGRDIEMSVASTKAFYSQIVAGTLLSLQVTAATGRRTPDFVADEIEQLRKLPDHMRKVMQMREEIQQSAQRISGTKTYWAVVGSGPNKASADEIRIKLSELCYKTISTDYVEDKKHIDLSSEPLIIVCAAGTGDTVIGDIIKDTAIFHAHKASTVVITDEGEHRFDAYADDVFGIPAAPPHLAPILNTLVGHLWGYYAALTINEGSRMLYGFRGDLQEKIDDFAAEGLTVYEAVLEESFRGKIIRFYRDFRKRQSAGRLPMPTLPAADLTLLMKYLAGRLPVADFEIDFDRKGTALNMLNILMEKLGEAIGYLARPVDAIKHQAKTVTVGTSRISEKMEGLLFEKLVDYQLRLSQLTTKNILVLRNLQTITERIEGAILYKIAHLNLLGEPTEETTIEVLKKEGVLKPIPSRVESDNRLKGTKRIIVRQGNVYAGKGRKDNRSIIVVPLISTAPGMANQIEHLLLMNISFYENVPLAAKVRALGGKFEHIKNIVQENSLVWKDEMLEWLPVDELFGRSAEKISEVIIEQASNG